MCARHVYANFSKRWAGVHFRNLFWAAAKSTYVEKFNFVLERIKEINDEAYHYLADKRPITWSRAFYKNCFACDAVENGISECWNFMIKDTRMKPILVMLEDIRLVVMQRMVEQRTEGELWTHEICPLIRMRLEESKNYNRDWVVYASGIQEYEVRTTNRGECFYVQMQNNTCSCGHWQVSGIPCPHAVATIYHLHKNPDDFVSDMLKKGKFLASYQYFIRSVGGEIQWPRTNKPEPLPPVERRMPGRPCVKRKRSSNESRNGSGKSRRCRKCFNFGHNRLTCTKEQVPPPPKVSKKRGRPRCPDQSRSDCRAGTSAGTGGSVCTMGSRGGVFTTRGGGTGDGFTSAAGLVDVPIEDANETHLSQEDTVNLSEDVDVGMGDQANEGQTEGCVIAEVDRARLIAKKKFVPPRKKSERIICQKLAKVVETADGLGLSKEKPLTL